MIGLIVNPVAGLGGPVGLKGTDGVAEQALKMGAVPRAQIRAAQMLTHLGEKVVTCGGCMGADAAEKAGVPYTVVYEPSTPTSREDTVRAASIMEDEVDILLFCGGDGTARDISSVTTVPVLGVPAGVKMYSACFAKTPQTAAETVELFLNQNIGVTEVELLDINEPLYRKGVLSVHLYGYARVPQHANVQHSKQIVADSTYYKKEIASFVTSILSEDTVYILGAGTTLQAIGDLLGIDKTLLGVDIVKGNTLVKKDCSERDILEVLQNEQRIKIIVSPIGGQGFILGRGNQQISPQVLKETGPENLIIVATPQKLVNTPRLHVDTGDSALDSRLKGEHLVICGVKLAVRKEVV